MNGLTAFTPIEVGFSQRSKMYVALNRMSNPHILACGKSGSGKSHLIKNIIAHLYARGLTVHVLALHPDYSYEEFVKCGAGSLVHEDALLFMNYDYVGGNASINPLEFNPQPENGGVFMAIQDFVEVAKLFNPSMGSRQATYLQKILEETYQEKGILHDDPETWVRNIDGRASTAHHPNLFDVRDKLQEVMKAVNTGLNVTVFQRIGALNKKLRNLKRKRRHSQDEALTAEIEEQIEKNIEAIEANVKQMIRDQVYGETEAPFYAGWKVDTLETLADIINGMITSTLFTRGLDSEGGVIKPRKGRINVHQLSHLSYDHQATMIHILLNRLYSASMRMCKNLNPQVPDTYIVLDEGRYAQEAAKTPMSPLNVIFGGSRKFGLGMIIGVQGPDQLSKDMAENFCVKFVLASSESSYGDAKKYFNVGPAQMKRITARQDALLSVDGAPFELTRIFPRAA